MTAEARGARYSTLAIVLHWTIAALIILQIILAGRMEGRTPEAFAVVQFHKSIGITVLLLSLVRLAWRLLHPPPPEPEALARWERTLSTGVHWAFYAVMIGMPLTGWIMVSTSRIVLPTLLFGTIAWPHVPGLAELAPAAKKPWHDLSLAGHGLIIKGAYVLIALHVAGALKHQLFGREEPVLSRMAPGAVSGRWWEPRLLVIAVGVAAVVAFGRFYEPPHPATGVLPPPPPPPPVEEAVALPAVVAPAPAGAPVVAPTPAGPAKWVVSPGSTLGFATSWSGEAIQGRFDKWTADILFSPDALDASKLTVTIDLTSVKTGDEQRDASLPSGDWFDVAEHPKAIFTASKFTQAGEGRFVAHGKLSLRGVSRPLDLPFRLKITGDTASVSGVTTLDRTAFGVGQGEWQSTDSIPAKVTVTVALKARRR